MNRSAGLEARLLGNARRRAVPEAGAPILRFMVRKQAQTEPGPTLGDRHTIIPNRNAVVAAPSMPGIRSFCPRLGGYADRWLQFGRRGWTQAAQARFQYMIRQSLNLRSVG
jgi:hypothetical protein